MTMVNRQGRNMSRSTLVFLSAIVLLPTAGASRLAAQGNPTGIISGHVAGQDGLSLPGVLVTVSSPVLQGVRTATTSANGDYIIPFLPSGDHQVTFELQGFQTLKKSNITVTMAETQRVDITLKVAAIQETVTVTGNAGDIVSAATVASNFKKEALERLPVGRSLNDAVLLAPGTAGNGPSGNVMMSGALSFESQYL